MAIKKYTTSKDGIETQFAANHVGHFLLTNLLLPNIIAAGPDSRIINVSSFGYLSAGVRFDDWNFKDGAEYNPWHAYAQSKTAIILFTHALADKLKGKVLAFSLNPGLILESKLMTNVTKEMFADGHRITLEAMGGRPMPSIAPKSLAAGASTTLYGALDPDLKNHSGAFLNHGAIYDEELLPHAASVKNQQRLWDLSEKLVGQIFSY
jgi:NAD(P)-dependent dehydrogenase (short-subunit alcohol dehydrogenase family)